MASRFSRPPAPFAAALALGIWRPAAAGGPEPFSFDAVRAEARALAAAPYREAVPELPCVLAGLDYDGYRRVVFRRDKAVWLADGLPFQLHFYHLGYLYRRPVAIETVAGGRAAPLPFSPDFFEYHPKAIGDGLEGSLGFAGFRVTHRFPDTEKLDEVIGFLGASYFRALGRGEAYGASARGVAIDTGMPRPEEFPDFIRFWIERPSPAARDLRFWALLDGPSATGAYAFVLRPGDAATIDVEAHLILRRPVEKLGIAPITSMFLFGESPDARFRERRPEVHDSDGLLVHGGSGEVLWRPLRNPRHPSACRFQASGLRGFGLVQRDRDFDHYRDREALYHLRPSVWVEPLSPWGEGSVELVELPSEAEGYDNIVSFWVPARAPPPGTEAEFRYRLRFGPSVPAGEGGGRTVATRVTDAAGGGQEFEVDFRGGGLDALGPDSPPAAAVEASRGRVAASAVHRLAGGTWRLSFRVEGAGPGPADVRAFLRKGPDFLTETWTDLAGPP